MLKKEIVMKKYIKKSLIPILFLLSCAGATYAQQEAMYSQYMFNTLAVNPAYAGSRNALSATSLYRSQWSGIDGAPRTITFTIDAPLMDKRMGLGLQVFDDKLGVTHTTGGVLSYAYRIRFNEASLSFGMQGTAMQYRADFSNVSLDPLGVTDPAFGGNVSRLMLNAGAGVYYNSDRFYVGLSAPKLISSRNSYRTSSGVQMSTKQFTHLFLAAGYVFPLSDNFDLKPSFLVKAVEGAPIEADLNATLWIKSVFAVGFQYRTSADVSGMVEIQATPQIRLGYQYDRSVTRLQEFNRGSHEVMLRYEFGLNRDKVLSPRFF
jgi:type IX secretion system PorP/SprF family membrane protein